MRLACFRDDGFESIKRVAFNFEKEIKKLNETSRGFEFTYWWLYSNQEYHVDVTLETGNYNTVESMLFGSHYEVKEKVIT